MSKLLSIIGATVVVLSGINAKKNFQLSKHSDFLSRRPRFLCWVLPTSE